MEKLGKFIKDASVKKNKEIRKKKRLTKKINKEMPKKILELMKEANKIKIIDDEYTPSREDT